MTTITIKEWEQMHGIQAKGHILVWCLVSMFGCVSGGSDTPPSDCRMTVYQCAEGFTCESSASGTFMCVRESAEMPDRRVSTEPIDAGLDEGITDCRIRGCEAGAVCLSDPFGGFACSVPSRCAENNGGCGDPTYTDCVEFGSNSVECIDIPECEFDNGGCGNPYEYFCIERDGAPPYCEPIAYVASPFVVGTFVEVLSFQGPNRVEHCHAVFMPQSRGTPDTSNGCERCSFAWEIEYELVYSSCDVSSDNRQFVFEVGVDMVEREILLKSNGQWTPFQGGGILASITNNSIALGTSEINPSGATFGNVGDVYYNHQFLELTWEDSGVSCGDTFCDFSDWNCGQDCSSGGNPASGYVFRAYSFEPETSTYSNCIRIRKLLNHNFAPRDGCNGCSDSWLFQQKVILSNCTWGSRTGSISSLGLGARFRDQMTLLKSDTYDWVDITDQFSTYLGEYSSLVSSFDENRYQDIDGDGRRDSNEPLRTRTQVIVIHHE